MKKKKLLFVIWSFTYGGGAEAILANLVNRMDFEKYEIDILEYWHSDIKILQTNPKINILKPVIDSTKDSHIKMWIAKILLEYFPNILRKKYIKKDYDYEIAFNSLIPTYLLTKKGKTISWNHTDIYDLKKDKYNYWLEKKAYKHINKIVAISENTYNSIVELYPQYKDKTLIINNSFDFEQIDKLVTEKISIKKNNFTFLYAGRLDERKNPLYLIEVAKKLKDKNYNFEIWMIGEGNLREKVEKKIKEYRLENNVKLLGFQKNPYPYFNICDVVVMTSTAEGFPTVIAEGLYLGKPFISTNIGGTKELSDKEQCGFVAENLDDYVSFAEQLMTDKELYNKMSNHGNKHVQTFTYEKQIGKFEKLLLDMDDNI